jgi:NFU1 iron-sulfur cluster scaffold homolog, mitochondrial
MSVHAQSTPNPNALKFVVAGTHFARPLSYASASAAASDPLAAQLFALDGVYNVFMAQDFVTVNKRPDVAWDDLAPLITQIIEDGIVRTNL